MVVRTQAVAQLQRRVVWGMALASGATVANLYYNQPLLPEIARTFGASDHAIGLIPTLTQIGYGAGMLLVVPLGDSHERRRLVLLLTGLVAILLALAAAAPSLAVLAAASLAIGISTCVPQILIPYAATLAAPAERGRVVGTVTGGLLFGVLLSRTLAGIVGEALGWRAVYLLAAALMVMLGIVLRLELPRSRPAAPMRYATLLRSLHALVREEPVLRIHALLGGLAFAALSAFWATLALFLRDLPGHYGPRTAGLFGVVGVVGAVAAPLVGRATDARTDRRINAVAIATMLVGFAVLAAAGGSLLAIAVAVVLLDFGVQANHVSNQTRIFSLREEARSRLNTVYMVTYFGGGALGAYAGAVAYASWGWIGVCAVGGALSAAGLVVILRS
jgi:predicted MFS family arabinose efflux permease